ncbi:hypothetical protein F5146DRAFT_1133816 [Armillaria mellea]|nr:hypothetical protein F5146DRAFT_1133816 [Armillaria mellea]
MSVASVRSLLPSSPQKTSYASFLRCDVSHQRQSLPPATPDHLLTTANTPSASSGPMLPPLHSNTLPRLLLSHTNLNASHNANLFLRHAKKAKTRLASTTGSTSARCARSASMDRVALEYMSTCIRLLHHSDVHFPGATCVVTTETIPIPVSLLLSQLGFLSRPSHTLSSSRSHSSLLYSKRQKNVSEYVWYPPPSSITSSDDEEPPTYKFQP